MVTSFPCLAICITVKQPDSCGYNDAASIAARKIDYCASWILGLPRVPICPSQFADLSAAIDAGVLSVLVVEHLLRCASSKATASTIIPLLSLRGVVGAAFVAVTREGETARVGVMLGC